MTDGKTIRRAREADTASVLALWRESEASPTVTDDSDTIAQVLCDDHAALFVAEDTERVVGTVIAGFDGWRGSIYRLAVAPSHRRRGIAAALVREAESALFAMGARRITAIVESDHPWAVAFWDAMSRHGFERDPLKIRYIRNRP